MRTGTEADIVCVNHGTIIYASDFDFGSVRNPSGNLTSRKTGGTLI